MFCPLFVIAYVVVTGFLRRLYDILGNATRAYIVAVDAVEYAALAGRWLAVHIVSGLMV